MDEQILERIKREFLFIGDEMISGRKAIKIINDIFDELNVPADVKSAQVFLAECHRDLGFMGSPEYDRRKKIVDDYFGPIMKKWQEENDRKELARLKQLYDGSAVLSKS